jgi:pimeloyl-ACP methyl ester carboxylesterase
MVDSMSIATHRFTFTSEDGLLLAGDRAGRLGAPSVVLLHGGGQTRHSWGGAMRELAARGYYVVNLDARGHGASEWAPSAGQYSLGHFSSDLKVLLASLPHPPVLVGASMGGLTVLDAIGCDSPSIASALVLVDVVPRMETSGAQRVLKFMRANAGGFASLEEAAAAVAAYNPHRPPPRSTDGLMKNLRRSDDGRLLWHWDPKVLEVSDMHEKETREQLLKNCRHFSRPAMLVRGLLSDIVGEAGITELKDNMPQLEVFDVAAAGHMIAGDKNDAFNAGLLAFLREHVPV